jgi:hypothetical protein
MSANESYNIAGEKFHRESSEENYRQLNIAYKKLNRPTREQTESYKLATELIIGLKNLQILQDFVDKKKSLFDNKFSYEKIALLIENFESDKIERTDKVQVYYPFGAFDNLYQINLIFKQEGMNKNLEQKDFLESQVGKLFIWIALPENLDENYSNFIQKIKLRNKKLLLIQLKDKKTKNSPIYDFHKNFDKVLYLTYRNFSDLVFPDINDFNKMELKAIVDYINEHG